jgi:hypothetical protein
MGEASAESQPVTDAPGTAGAAAEAPAPTAAEAPTGAAAAGTTLPPIVDVWSRTQPKYRIRAVVLLLVNLLLYCGLCVFIHWLHFARPFDFSLSSYLAPARFWGAQTQSLNDFITYPINVEQTPVHGVVLGLLLAAVVAVPIVVAILYRFLSALAFVAAVLVFAHMPGMAATLTFSCILASVRPFRMSFRFGSALLGMLPVVLYLYLATRGETDQLVSYASPTETTLLAAPWVLTILAACVMTGIVLLISRLVDYRPGGVAPVVAVMFTAPLILFHVKVGADEVAYRVLEAEYGPHSQRFEPVEPAKNTSERISALIRQLAMGTMKGTPFGPYHPDFLDLWGGNINALKRPLWIRLQAQFLADRTDAYEACKRFIADHPGSRYVPNVYYMQARILDTRLDRPSFMQNPPRRELYSDFPHVQSAPSWSPLFTQYPESPLSIAAGLRLAQLHLRRGEIDQALERLSTVRQRGTATLERLNTTQPARGLLRAALPESSLEFQPKPCLFEARRLHELITANRDDPRYGSRPLEELAALDPHRAQFHRQLLRLAARYPDSFLYDNLVVLWASTLPDQQLRAEKLEACTRRFSSGDALPEAMFRLAELEIQALGSADETRRAGGIERMRALANGFPGTCWGQAAAERLELLEPRGQPATTRAVQP